ncbi:MAG: ADP-ribosylglycohydrolase family protein [Anaerolineae bacterium]|nr:ADP-ribosylglycohydrolase family protein [Anaerolineae bacterium]
MQSLTREQRFLGAMFGLAYGDAISFPALFHRFQALPARRHNYVWRTNQQHSQQQIARLTLPFTHRIPAATLEPSPTDDTEWAVLTLKALIDDPNPPTQETFLRAWQDEVVPQADTVWGSFSERSAIENFKRGLLPPATGNDNPLHYEDNAVARAVPIGLYYAGQPDQAAALAELDAQITQAEDGIYAARGMAAAIALLADGGSLADALHRARQEFPTDSWIAHVDEIAQACVLEASTLDDLIVLLATRVINTVYSFGSLAPETFPAALAIVAQSAGDLSSACLQANTLAKASDSLPAMVGALCGAYQGVDAISAQWRACLATCRGVCLPFLAGTNLEDLTLQLVERLD